MTAHPYSEDQLVEQPAIQLLAALGWQTVSAVDEAFGADGTLGRETKSEVLLAPRLRAALERLNPALPPDAISAAAAELARDRSAMSRPAANREIYALLKDGVQVSVPDREHGSQKTERARVVDWETPAANDFLVVSQLSVLGALYTRRPDLVGFVNGLPFVVVELKKPGVPARAGFDDNLTCYKADIPALLAFNALLIASNGTDSRVGSLTADWERFFEWKRVEREDEPRRVSLETMLRGTCAPTRLLDLVENFTLFSEHKTGLVKVLGQNHQVLGVNNAIAASLKLDAEEKTSVQKRLDSMRATDMALIVSPGQNEVAQMQALGLDIVPHRKRMNVEALDEKFKDPSDPLQLVFLCAMWLTGFDAPSCSTVYLDKPMRNHTLMQTIARANRVFPGKHSGMIVDYANVFASLEKALAIYGKGKGGERPLRDKSKLVGDLRKAVKAAVTFCAKHGVEVAAIEKLPSGSMKRLSSIAAAVDALISPDPLRKEFLAHERLVYTLYEAVKPDPAVVEFAGRVAFFSAIAGEIRTKLSPGPPDISGVLKEIGLLLDSAITGVEVPAKPAAALDLSMIDFKALQRRFERSKTRNIDLEQLKAAIRRHLDRMIRLNRTRMDFRDKFEELIESYNAGSRSIEELFKELLELSRSLTDEEHRHVREGMTEEELVVLDLLTRPAPDLTLEERNEVKKVARALLAKLKGLLVLDWRQKAAARAQVKLAIEDLLDGGLPRAYSKDVYKQKCSSVFEHFYENYSDSGTGAYAAVG
ncbi:MAG: type I restriction endonuclease subunit R [Planctomycetes bacterium]|nr:type I restriction endonuclease subunit R [Planctomycetota bacterium]